ncbi:hypothetical protein [Conexibacter sp. SYSU D00693]|uniref:hypothetical protein n=1 Tax=Conexibacter sp. SYSU D00693 TaxID=2812560 RepID=UPI00196B758C|nr:hypothetical protein [Conexibacter sp. SYSU D00693]
MVDQRQPGPLIELPYGTRQRVVVVPDDVLDAEQVRVMAGDQERPWRPWDVLRGDPQHPTLRTLKEADEEGLRLLPVRQSQVDQLDMPVGHPLPNVVYIGSPAVARRYYPMADFHVRVFEERFGEAMRLLMALGAERVTVRSERGWKRDVGTDIEAPIKRVLKNQAELRFGSRRDRSLVFEAELVPTGVPEVPEGLVWFDYEPTWKAVVEARERYGLREFQLHVTSRENFGIDADVASKIGRRKVLSLGGRFTQQVDTSWVLEGTFGDAPKRGWRRGP